MLVVISVVSYRSTIRLVETGRLVAHTREVLEKLETVLAQMASTESGVRGYIIAGEERYLEPYRAAIAAIDHEVKELRRLTADNPNQQRRLDVLEPLVAGRIALVTEMIDVRKNWGFEAARQLVLMDKERGLMDAIRGLIGEAEHEERGLLQRRDEEATRSDRR